MPGTDHDGPETLQYTIVRFKHDGHICRMNADVQRSKSNLIALLTPFHSRKPAYINSNYDGNGCLLSAYL